MNTVTITPQSITKVGFFVSAKFPSGNKNDQLKDYDFAGATSEDAKVEELIVLSDADFKQFKNSLMSDQSWLKGKGGHNSTFETKEENFFNLSSEDQESWKKGAYRVCLMVQNTKGDNILVDPQGYSYARYCGKLLR